MLNTISEITEKYLNQKRIQNFATKQGIEIITGLDHTTDENDLNSLEVVFYFREECLKDSQTEDDMVIYSITSNGLEFTQNYQVEGVTLPSRITTIKELKHFLVELSKAK